MDVIIQEGCITCGLCVSTCPAVFAIGSQCLAEVISAVTAADEPAVREAAEACPVSVIALS